MFIRLFSTKRINIPKAVREQVWLNHFGKNFETKCPVDWCNNKINVFDFTLGHNKALSKGGENKIENFIPICGRCNSCMGNKYTIDEWSSKW